MVAGSKEKCGGDGVGRSWVEEIEVRELKVVGKRGGGGQERWWLKSPPGSSDERSWRWLRAEGGLRVQQRIREKAMAGGSEMLESRAVTVKDSGKSCLVVGCDGVEAHDCGVAQRRRSRPGGLGNGGRAQQRYEGSGGGKNEEWELQRMGDDNRERAG
ncbi:hypothetical protein AMTR_s00173p00049890 [Amborella trichopoda]|uniref:Uncharacterized protein n=1 Tax=Amborella trichopoda TaxID=13333 RepID=W1NRG1_AMBTC|nr:hypothetical protein AMTR_s00173p00049890 [Amborella trichopoda]